uniref:DNA helicase n=1 Tax=Piliocolobus tephrosceles TaxID=591936 RepID=A0A8C9GF00_9PRIM
MNNSQQSNEKRSDYDTNKGVNGGNHKTSSNCKENDDDPDDSNLFNYLLQAKDEIEANDSNIKQSNNIEFSKHKKENVIKNIEKKKHSQNSSTQKNIPLYKLYQPVNTEDYICEKRIKYIPLLKKIFLEDLDFSLIICGPPGSGKSSLINVIKNKTNHTFTSLSHLHNFNNELRQIFDQSIQNFKMFKKKTILCIKDINRLNKAQQEYLLSVYKQGNFFLISTCLYYPGNILNKSLASRCRYLYLEPYDKIELSLIIKRVLKQRDIDIEENALNAIIEHSGGDARVAINIMDTALQHMEREDTRIQGSNRDVQFDNKIKEGVSVRTNEQVEISQVNTEKYTETNEVEYDKEMIKNNDSCTDKSPNNESKTLHNNSTHVESKKKILQLNTIKLFLQNFPCKDNVLDHYNFISALHKSIRGGDTEAAVLYLMKALRNGEDPLYICRRLIRIASEDIGLADNTVLSVCVNTHYACQAIGMPECQTSLIYAVVVLCKSAKSNYIYLIESRAKQICNDYPFDVPAHLKNSSDKYKYTNQPEILTFEKHLNRYKGEQTYLPKHLENLKVLPEL